MIYTNEIELVKTTHKGKIYVTGVVENQRRRKMNQYDEALRKMCQISLIIIKRWSFVWKAQIRSFERIMLVNFEDIEF